MGVVKEVPVLGVEVYALRLTPTSGDDMVVRLRLVRPVVRLPVQVARVPSRVAVTSIRVGGTRTETGTQYTSSSRRDFFTVNSALDFYTSSVEQPLRVVELNQQLNDTMKLFQ